MTLLDSRPESAAVERPRTYEVRTFGCQMNVHDSERLSGSLEAAGYIRADGAEADIVVINTCAVRENADNKLYGTLGHLASTKREHEGMQIAVGGCLAQKDKSVILEKRPLGRRRLRHPQHGSPSRAARACPAQRRGAARDPRVARGLPVDAADPPRVDVQRLGVHLGRLQQHLHLLHRAVAARQGEGPPPRRHPRRDRAARRRRRHRGHPARSERELVRRRVRRPARVRQAAARRRRRSTAWSGCASPARIRPRSPTTSSTPWPRPPTSCRSCTCRCSPAPTASSRRCAAPTVRSSSSASSTGCATASRTPRSRPTSSSASPARPRRTSRRPCASSSRRGSSSAFTFQYSIRPGTPAATLPDQVPKAVVQERYERLVELQERISGEENAELDRQRRRGARRERRGSPRRRAAPHVRARRRRPARPLRRSGRRPRSRAPATW